jgi:hypothetical protein
MASAPFTYADQANRVARAMRETFDWKPLPNGRWLCETEGGKCYEVSETACSCPDHQHRCAQVGALCKHRVSLNHKLMAEEPTAPAAVETYRVVGCARSTGRCKIIRKGMTQQAAEELRQTMRFDPLTTGFSIFVQKDTDELPW